VGSQQGLPRLPEMQGQRASTSVWPSVHLRGAGAPQHPLSPGTDRVPRILARTAVPRIFRSGRSPTSCTKARLRTVVTRMPKSGIGDSNGAIARASLYSFHDHRQHKMITGHYLGQLVRLESVKLIRAQRAHPSKDRRELSARACACFLKLLAECPSSFRSLRSNASR
jgi:hypothetical protein